MNGEIDKEIGIHGGRWESLHGGYFSDPIIAEGMIGAVTDIINQAEPAVLVDLGGTGYLLSALLERGLPPNLRLVNLDLSARQLSRATQPRITTLHDSLDGFNRNLAASRDERLLCIMRSALHYAGRDGLLPALRHIRTQMESGEYFIHQTACFSTADSADCMNAVYAGMGSGKWYPTIDMLGACLKDSGWDVQLITGAPRLCFDSDQLKERYLLTDDTVRTILARILRDFGEKEDLFIARENGFTAFLPYSIFRCRAVR